MPAAVAIPAIIGAAGIVSGASSASKARKAQEQSGRDATAAETAAQQSAQAFQQKQADQARADQEPWRTAGGNALTQLTQRMAPGGDLMRNFNMGDFEQDPGYQFRLAEGQKGLNNSMASRGMALSGAALKATTNYNQGAASAEYGNAFARYKGNQEGQYNKLASLAGVGQIAANNNGSNAMQLGQSVGNGLMNSGTYAGNNLMGAGNARASGYLAQSNTIQNGLNQGLSAWNQYQNNKPSPYMVNNAENVQPGASGTWNG